MNHKQIVALAETHQRPMSPEEVGKFLADTRDGDVPLFFSNKPYYLFALFAPNRLLQADFVEDVALWSMSIAGGYGYGLTYRSGDEEPCLFDPLDRTGSEILDQGIAPLFLRHFEGRDSYVEPNQWLTHVLEIHKTDQPDAWCRVNELGELVPVLRVVEGDRLSVCTIARDRLDRFLVSADMSMVRLFVVNAAEKPELLRQEPERKDWHDPKLETFLTTHFVKGELAYVRGFDVVRVSPRAKELAMAALRGDEQREYATFLINDFRNKRTIEWSTEPAQTGNYFVESELPYGTSPAFFKPEVLSQYRTDPGRFRIMPDRVECTGAWSISYYVNDEGLVHAYLCDLSRLPHQEQLRWKAFNVAPDGGIAKKAWERDFMAEWPKDYDPLLSLRDVLTDFPEHDEKGNAAPVWLLGVLPPERDLDFVGYVVTNARKEFYDQIMALAQILVEGLNASYINALAKKLGCRDDKLASGKQLAKVLEAVGIDEATRAAVTEPLAEVWAIRSRAVAHKGTDKISGDQRLVFRDLLARCDKAMRLLRDLVRTGRLTLT